MQVRWIESRSTSAQRDDVIHIDRDRDDALRQAMLADVLVAAQDDEPNLLPPVVIPALAAGAALRLRFVPVAVAGLS